MDSFRQDGNAPNYEVHTGLWTDWTNGPVLGATITLNKRDGSFLIAFIALFVSVVGTSFWRICCFALHRFYSTHVAQDALYHQRQAIFRNAANGTSGLWGFLNIWWEWRKTAVDRPSYRLLPAAGIALCCVGAFATAGTFSSKISTAANGVLVRSPDCGILDSDNNRNLNTSYRYYLPWAAQTLNSWGSYALDCHLNVSDLGSCNAFIQPQLPTKIDRNASCPFKGDICKSEYGNIAFETSVDSHSDLGLNAPPHERINFRRISSCAPIRTDGYWSMYHSSVTGMNYSRYYYGTTSKMNATYEYPEVYWSSDQHVPRPSYSGGGRYTVVGESAFISNGSYLESLQPIPALRQHDADTHLIFLSGNGLLYTDKVNDPWFAATTGCGGIISSDENNGRIQVYCTDQPVSVLACTVKEQYCNPNLPTDKQCSPLGGTYESPYLADGLWKNEKQRAAFGWISAIIYAFSVTIENVPGILKEGALLASYKTQLGVSGGLPNNQWQLEAEYWHAATLVALQGSMTQVAKGTTNENLKSFLRSPKNADERNLCNSQKIPIGPYSNFSALGLFFTFGLGFFIICLSYMLEPLTSWIQKRRNSRSPNYACMEWVTHETLQLQRQAYEQSGIGVWEGCANSVPVIKGGEKLAVLDLEDPACPRLKVASLQEVVVEAVQIGPEESERDVKRADGGEQDSIRNDGARVGNSGQSGDDGEGSPENSVTDVSSILSGRTQHTGATN